ncbi:MAG: radical SAM family heme chaperone HemW [Bacilli bacterium]|nr:radical SAM family heme chaperone HemW [Bacilli bacterium]
MLTALYLHIPFCNQICVYCDFHKEIASLKKKTSYVEALCKEIFKHKDELKHIETIYIGGGTPSSLPIELLEKIFISLHQVIDIDAKIEFSIETNPNDITDEFVTLISRYGVNRVSIGVQTFHEKHLAFLGRTHRESDVHLAIDRLHRNGITNINIDMMFSLVNQTEIELELDLKKVSMLDITHISYYSLIFEEKTKLYHLYEQNKVSMNGEDLEAVMYNMVLDTLIKIGFEHYEISNFAKDGFESKHNITYWYTNDYLGLGSGSHSLINGKRSFHPANITKYISQIEQNEDNLTYYDVEPLRETLLMGLRMMKGINVAEINCTYQIDLLEMYPKLHDFIKDGYLVMNNEYLAFTRKGLLLGNIIFGIF